MYLLGIRVYIGKKNYTTGFQNVGSHSEKLFDMWVGLRAGGWTAMEGWRLEGVLAPTPSFSSIQENLHK